MTVVILAGLSSWLVVAIVECACCLLVCLHFGFPPTSHWLVVAIVECACCLLVCLHFGFPPTSHWLVVAIVECACCLLVCLHFGFPPTSHWVVRAPLRTTVCLNSRVDQNHIYIYIRCIYGIFGRGITKYTAIYGVYIQFWPTLLDFNSINASPTSLFLLRDCAPAYKLLHYLVGDRFNSDSLMTWKVSAYLTLFRVTRKPCACKQLM